MMSYRTIRSTYQPRAWAGDVAVDHYAYRLSPFLTPIFVDANIAPNTVTILMMAAGLVGSLLFAMPPIALKACGLIFIHLWYVLDCCDGETARITKRFSKFGKEMDYVAHVVNHPLFNLAFAVTLVGLGRYSVSLILFASLLCISAELVLRNIVSFSYLYELKMNSPVLKRDRRGILKKMSFQIVCFFSVYPNFALLFPLAYFADLYFDTSVALYYLLAHTAVSSLLALWRSFRWGSAIVSV